MEDRTMDEQVKKIIDRTFSEVDSLIREVRQQKKKETDRNADYRRKRNLELKDRQ
jgi:hypothetical protein